MKKKILYGTLGVVGFFILIGIFAGGGSENRQPVQNQDQEKAPREAMKVDTASFVAEFDKNQLAAEEKYEGRIIEFTAKIKNISEDILGTPFLSLEPLGAGDFYFGTPIMCSFKEKSAIISLQNGQTITLLGEVESQSLGIIGVDNCKVVQ